MPTFEMDPVTAEQRAWVARDICAREGHNWADVTTRGDRWHRGMCIRGCGARAVREPRGQVTPAHLRELADELEGHAISIRWLEIAVEALS